ncbi:histidine--tRNA ligase [TM7 phylum sp. oral taxon 348]|nr:histidine--tRNA ligase [TM7 phylum sp. oral taxon 348]TWP19397.1 histidine--tRNA ligase [TM7 phylum sp. oral taxon 348]TWP19596.1 histidine--tRNA ligase [TM7 phylum sp. oral taxon 348]
MSLVKPRIPSGFPEYLPAEQIEFNRLVNIVRRVYEEYGFSPIDTPDLELSEVLLTKSGGETEQQIYRFIKGSNDLTMRFDLTVPLARYVAQHESELIFPFRRYHIGKVHRGERAQAGRFREFYQCDIDVIGSNSVAVDAEMPIVINKIFEQFDIGEFTVHINNRKILNGFFESLGLSNISKDVLRIVDKIDKISANSFTEELEQLGLSADQITRLREFININGSKDVILNKLEKISLNCKSDQFKQGVKEVGLVVKTIRDFGLSDSRFMIDLRIARGLDYYTGTVYETTLNNHPEIGSICSGGRYDNLASHYTKKYLPGVGVSIGLSRLFYKLCEIGAIELTRFSSAEVVVMPIGSGQITTSVRIAERLRSTGINTMLYTEENNMRKKLKYADKMGFEWVVLIGEDELLTEEVMLKNMLTGESIRIKSVELDSFLLDKIKK